MEAENSAAKSKLISLLRKSEKYTKTDMVYLLKGGFWLNLNNVISSGLSFVLSILFAKYVSKEAYGSYQFLISFASILGTLTLTGMNAAVTGAVARGFEGIYRESVRIQVKYSLLPIFAGVVAALYYFYRGNSELSVPLIAVAIFMPLANAFNTWSAYTNAKKDFYYYFYQSQKINLIYYIAMIGCIYLVPTSTALVFVNFLALSVGNWLVYRASLNKFRPNENRDPEAIRYGKNLSVSSVLPLIALHIDNILVFHLLGPTQLAIYAFASNIPEKFMSLVRPISTLAFPKIAVKETTEARNILGPKVLRFLILSIFMSAIFIIAAPYLYKIFFPKYIESVIYSQAYILAAAIAATTSFCVSYMFATRSSKIFYYNAINPVVNIGFIVLGAYLFGIWGVIGARVVGSTFSLLFSFLMEK